MKIVRKIAVGLLLLFVVLIGIGYAKKESLIIKIDGSSTVYPITEAVAEEFQKAKKGTVKITVGLSGTGGGFKKFGRGETDISNASRPILKAEIELCKKNGIKYIELPVAYDGLAVIINPKNNWVNNLSVEELKKIWEPEAQNSIKKWSQIRDSWPDEPLRLFGPGVDSGTFDYFTEVIVGKSKASRGDYTASEDDNILVQGISGNKYALGYFGLAYYEENKDRLRLVPIVNPKSLKPVLPSIVTVMDDSYQPLSRPLFIYVNLKSLDRPEVKEFVSFYLKNAPELTKEVGYIPLGQGVYKLARERLTKRKTGSLFEGETDGAKIEDLLKR